VKKKREWLVFQNRHCRKKIARQTLSTKKKKKSPTTEPGEESRCAEKKFFAMCGPHAREGKSPPREEREKLVYSLKRGNSTTANTAVWHHLKKGGEVLQRRRAPGRFTAPSLAGEGALRLLCLQKEKRKREKGAHTGGEGGVQVPFTWRGKRFFSSRSVEKDMHLIWGGRDKKEEELRESVDRLFTRKGKAAC